MADDPYRYLTAGQRAMTPRQRWPLYNGGAYDTVANPFGLGEGGQDYLFEAWKADFDALLTQGQLIAGMFGTYQQAGSGGWAQESRPVSRVSGTQFAVAGAQAGENLCAFYVAGRAVAAVQTASATGYVAASAYDEANNRTLVTVEDLVIDSGLSAVRLGQDPACAPRPPTTAAHVAGMDASIASLEAHAVSTDDRLAMLALRQALGDAMASSAMPGGMGWHFKTDELAVKTGAGYDQAGDFYYNASQSDTFTQALDTNAASGEGYTYRSVVPASAISTSGARVRLTFAGSTSAATQVDNVAIVERSGSTENGVATPTEIKFGGASGFTLSSGGSVVSDWIDFPLDEAKSYLLIYDVAGTNGNSRRSSSGTTYYKANTNSYNVANMGTPDATFAAVLFVTKIEVESAPQVMTLAPSAVAAAPEPSDVSVFFLHRALETISMGVDCKMRVSINNGANWTAIEEDAADYHELAAYDADYNLWRVDFDVSALTGTSFKWEIVTAAKRQRVRAVAALWG